MENARLTERRIAVGNDRLRGISGDEAEHYVLLRYTPKEEDDWYIVDRTGATLATACDPFGPHDDGDEQWVSVVNEATEIVRCLR